MVTGLISIKPINNDEALNRCNFHLKAEMSKLNFDVLSCEKYEEACRARSFGGSGMVKESMVLEAAKSIGANTMAFTAITTESIDGGLPFMASIRILDTKDGS